MGAAGRFTGTQTFGPGVDNWEIMDLDNQLFRQYSLGKWEIDLIAREANSINAYITCIAFHSREAAREAAELIRQALALQSVPGPDPNTCTHENRTTRRYERYAACQDVCEDCGTVFGEVD